MGGSHICADYSPSFTVVGADMFLRQFGSPSPTVRIGVPESHGCADFSPSFTVVGADMFLRNNIHHSEWSFSYSVESRIFVPIVHRLSRWSVRICFSDSSDRRPRPFGSASPSRIFVPIVQRLSRWSVRICFSATIFIIQNGHFHILLRVAYLCRLFTVFHGGRCGYVSPQQYSSFRMVIFIFC